MKWEAQADKALWSILQDLCLSRRGVNNIQVGEKRQEESSHRYAACDNTGKKPLVEQCVTAGQFQEGLDITEEVIGFESGKPGVQS